MLRTNNAISRLVNCFFFIFRDRLIAFSIASFTKALFTRTQSFAESLSRQLMMMSIIPGPVLNDCSPNRNATLNRFFNADIIGSATTLAFFDITDGTSPLTNDDDDEDDELRFRAQDIAVTAIKRVKTQLKMTRSFR